MNLVEYLLNSSPAIVLLETIQISHPAFSKTYYLVRNAQNGISATIEDSSIKDFEYYPFEIVKNGENDDMDESYRVKFGDLGEILPMELDRVNALGLVDSKVTVIYRQYTSDNLTEQTGTPVTLYATNFDFSQEGCQFIIEGKNIKDGRLGETYNLNKFPTVRAFL